MSTCVMRLVTARSPLHHQVLNCYKIVLGINRHQGRHSSHTVTQTAKFLPKTLTTSRRIRVNCCHPTTDNTSKLIDNSGELFSLASREHIGATAEATHGIDHVEHCIKQVRRRVHGIEDVVPKFDFKIGAEVVLMENIDPSKRLTKQLRGKVVQVRCEC